MKLSEIPTVIVHDPETGDMRDTWHRPIYNGPAEFRRANDERRDEAEPCDPRDTEDGCRLCAGHMGLHSPTPEQVHWMHQPDHWIHEPDLVW